MARNINEAIAEEEERELEEAGDLEDQQQAKEYEDEKGENIAPTAGMPSDRSYPKFVCVKCGVRSRVRHLKTTGVHCGKQMQLVDHEAKRSYPFGRTGLTRLKRAAKKISGRIAKKTKRPAERSKRGAKASKRKTRRSKPVAKKKSAKRKRR